VQGHRKPAPVAPVSATTARLLDEFHDQPFGGWAGERLPAEPLTPAPAPPQPVVIEPPPWAGREGDLASIEPSPTPRVDALAELRADELDELPAPPGPPMVYEPLHRPVFPPPDWRAEEAERQRVRAAEIQDELEPARSPYPARRDAEKGGREP